MIKYQSTAGELMGNYFSNEINLIFLCVFDYWLDKPNLESHLGIFCHVVDQMIVLLIKIIICQLINNGGKKQNKKVGCNPLFNNAS